VTYTLAIRIQDALDAKDPSYAHVLLHSLAKIYNHTPWNERANRLARHAEKFPKLVETCLRTCSQTGYDANPVECSICHVHHRGYCPEISAG
jgi:hypothetical protein